MATEGTEGCLRGGTEPTFNGFDLQRFAEQMLNTDLHVAAI